MAHLLGCWVSLVDLSTGWWRWPVAFNSTEVTWHFCIQYSNYNISVCTLHLTSRSWVVCVVVAKLKVKIHFFQHQMFLCGTSDWTCSICLQTFVVTEKKIAGVCIHTILVSQLFGRLIRLTTTRFTRSTQAFQSHSFVSLARHAVSKACRLITCSHIRFHFQRTGHDQAGERSS